MLIGQNNFSNLIGKLKFLSKTGKTGLRILLPSPSFALKGPFHRPWYLQGKCQCCEVSEFREG